MKRYLLPLTLMLVFFVTACYYDNEEALYPSLSSACDTTGVTFSMTIVPVLSSNCYSCHSNTTAQTFGNNIKLENYADVKSNATAVAGSIKQTGTYSPMPKNGGKLKQCSIRQFDIWVTNGMLNN